MAYEVILKPAGESPAPRPKSPPKERPLSQELIDKKLKEAEERRQVSIIPINLKLVYMLRIESHSPIRASNCRIDSPKSKSVCLDCMRIRLFLKFKSTNWVSRFEINWSACKIRSPGVSVNVYTVRVHPERLPLFPVHPFPHTLRSPFGVIRTIIQFLFENCMKNLTEGPL